MASRRLAVASCWVLPWLTHPGDGRAFRNPDAVLVLLECGDEFHELILTRKFKVSRVDAARKKAELNYSCTK